VCPPGGQQCKAGGGAIPQVCSSSGTWQDQTACTNACLASTGLCVACSPTTTVACDTGVPGICAAGMKTCDGTGAWGSCVQNVAKGTETCANPGTDDDCDGIVDNVPVTACDVGTGLGACANGGTTACSGTSQVCNPADAGIGVANVWHPTASPNGSWDWDCDGSVAKQFADANTNPTCTGLAPVACISVPNASYSLNGPMACGQVGDVGTTWCGNVGVGGSCATQSAQYSGQPQGCH